MFMKRSVLVLLACFVASCGPSVDYEVGDPVWVELQSDSILRRGHAEGRVLSISDDLVEVQVSRLDAPYEHDLVRTLVRGSGFVPIEIVHPAAEGRRKSEQLQSAVSSLTKIVESRSYEGWRIDSVESLNEELNNKEVAATLELLELASQFERESNTSALSRKVDRASQAMTELIEIAQEYPDLLAGKRWPGKLANNKSLRVLRGGRVSNDTLPVRVAFPIVFEVHATLESAQPKTLKGALSVYSDLLQVSDKLLELVDLVGAHQSLPTESDKVRQRLRDRLLETIRQFIMTDADTIADAEHALVREKVEQYMSKAESAAEEVGDAGVIEKASESLSTFLIIRILKEQDLSAVYSLDEAEEIFEETRTRWAWASALLGRDILTDNEWQKYFQKPVAKNIEARELERERQRIREEARQKEEARKREEQKKHAQLDAMLVGTWEGRFQCTRAPNPKVTFEVSRAGENKYNVRVMFHYFPNRRRQKTSVVTFNVEARLQGVAGALVFDHHAWMNRLSRPVTRISARIDPDGGTITGRLRGDKVCESYRLLRHDEAS